jgi:membrane-bound serine protease (ClpP class)
MGLILVGMFFLVLEMYVTSYGLLALAGISSFVLGSLFLFKGESGFISIDYPVLISTLAAVGACLGFFIWFLYQDSRKQHKQSNFFVPAGEKGMVVSFYQEQPMIKVRGEIWKAISDEPLSIGDQIQVMKVDSEHLVLHIKKV